MNINMGDTIKKLRRERDFTQEKFAEYLNISPQAVSRWETNAAYPDIALIPVIANFFGVTADVLLGMDVLRSEEKINAYIKEFRSYSVNGDFKSQWATIKKALSEFPGDFKILMQYAWTLSESPYRENDGEPSKEKIAEINREVVAICTRVLSDCTDDETRGDAIYLMSMTHAVDGDMESAVKAANRLPCYSTTRNFLLSNLYAGSTGNSDEARAVHGDNVQQLAWHLWIEIRHAVWTNDDADEKIRLLKKGLALYNLVYDDGDYGFYHTDISDINCFIADIYLEQGNIGAALEHLKISAHHCVCFDKMMAAGIFTHTSPLIFGFRFDPQNTSKGYNSTKSEQMIDKLASARYDIVRGASEFEDVLNQLRK
jgi:Predicted transcriptional regulators